MNSKIIETFQQLVHKTSNELKTTKNGALRFKISSYNKTIKIIDSLTFEISSGDQLKDIKGIGKTTIEKINEIINTGTLSQVQGLEKTILSRSKEIVKLQKITGIGPVKAEKLFDQHITLDTLLELDTLEDIDLTHHQKLGVKYFNDLEHKIPYQEITEMEHYIKEILNLLNLNLKMVICGSYRRMKATSGDIDVLIYSDINEINGFLLPTFLKMLKSKKFITDSLTSFDNPTKYMGFCKLKQYNRRIDIRLIQKINLGSAMLYFTGSGEFNKSMRTFALKKGYTINEYGIYRLNNGGTKGFIIKTQTEQDIFKVLKLDYVEPKDRIPEYKFK
jgi:DNA polymerase beta